MKPKTQRLLSKLYYTPSNPACFSTVDSLWKATHETVPRKEVQEWLEHQESYTLHRPSRKHIKRNRYYVDNIDNLWHTDLCDMRALNKYNDGYNYILTIIDTFSRYSWAVPLKTKTSREVSHAFSEIFKEGRKPLKIESDRGREFSGKPFQTFLKENNVGFYFSNNPESKACFAERFNRTLKTLMWKYFTYKTTKRYIDVLPLLLKSYNNRIHTAIKMPPSKVNDSNILQVWTTLYGDRKKALYNPKPKFAVGDTVRISKEKIKFEKGYEENWTNEVFKIIRVFNRNRIVYAIEDMKGEEIEGTFYEQELTRVRVKESTLYKIDKIMDTRGKSRSKEVLVSWVGHPSKFNTWLKAIELKRLQK